MCYCGNTGMERTPKSFSVQLGSISCKKEEKKKKKNEKKKKRSKINNEAI